MGFLTALFGKGGMISEAMRVIFSFGVITWILIAVMLIAFVVGIAYWISVARKKKKQWTHKLRVRRILQNGYLTEEVVHKCRRFPLEKGIEVFELEKPLLGSYLVPQPGEYTGMNEFSIILDPDNRVYLNKGYKYHKDDQSVHVSGVHAGIDVSMANMKDKWQQAHRIDKKITTAELIKAGLMALGIIALVIVIIMGLKEWGEAQQYHAQQSKTEAEAMKNINEAVQTMEKVVNTQQLQIVPMLEALYGKGNIAEEINKYREEAESVN